MESYNKCATVVINGMTSIVMANDVKGPEPIGKITFMHSQISLSYFHARFQSEWDSKTKQLLRPLFQNAGRLVQLTRDDTFMSATTLPLVVKSALVFMSEDFPDLADALLYSPLMETLDRTIEEFTVNGPEFICYESYLKSLEMMNKSSLASHDWWKILDNVKHIGNKPIGIHEYFHQHRERCTLEIKQIEAQKKHVIMLDRALKRKENTVNDVQYDGDYVNETNNETRQWRYLEQMEGLQNIGDRARMECAKMTVKLDAAKAENEKARKNKQISKEDKTRVDLKLSKAKRAMKSKLESLKKAESDFDLTYKLTKH